MKDTCKGTPYAVCYDAFLGLLDEHRFIYPYENESEEDFEYRFKSTLKNYFKRAVPKYINSITPLIRHDDVEVEYEGEKYEGCFVNVLRPLEIEIIALYMLKSYYRKKLNFLAGLKGSYSDKDWRSHDKSAQMNQYRQMLKEIDVEINSLSKMNTFVDDDGKKISDWLG